MAKTMSKMMRRTLKLGIFLTLGACLALPATAVGPAEGGLADLEIGGTAIHVTPLAAGRLSLRVSGPGDFVYEAEMKGGEGLVFEIFDAAGEVLPDGVYNYEITAWAGKPKAAERENLRGLEKGRDGALRQSGVFTIRGGSLVQPGLDEPPAERPAQKADRQVVPTKDIVHNDDVIITGSLCVGFDCVNGENFGFDTVRLKENNLRIKADDTSNSGSFPKNDWQLTFNDSANGGAEKFSIDDVTNGRTPFTIEASAPSHSLYVDDGGRLGLGTSTPVVDAHVVSGNTPTLRLEQNGSSGFTPQTWDVAGNETNFFIRDVTNGSKLPFRIRPTAPTDSLYINTNGDVGLGTSAPKADLHVLRGGSPFTPNADTAVVIQNSPGTGEGVILSLIGDDNGNAQIAFGDDTAEFRGRLVYNSQNAASLPDTLRFYTAGTERMRLSSTGDLTLLTGNCSDSNGGNPSGGVDGCDRVFHPDYELPSIEEHAASMWENSYLPAVGPTPEDGPWPVGRKAAGMLNELEKAHIYIEQLHQTIKELESRIEKIEESGK